MIGGELLLLFDLRREVRDLLVLERMLTFKGELIPPTIISVVRIVIGHRVEIIEAFLKAVEGVHCSIFCKLK